MEINNEHIKEAEALLIGGQEFDEKERIPFIKNLDSVDLLAVPGSGKTTALMAKLYCLSKKLPFSDGSGILVLSHTNAAVDEIEKHLKSTCPLLFTYPNFIGTVQSFINKFLVFPFYSQVLGFNNLRIDDIAYYKEVNFALSIEHSREVNYYKNKNKDIYFSSRLWFDNNDRLIISKGISNNQLSIISPKKWVQDGNANQKIKKVFDFIMKTKLNLLKKGILHFDDCYYVARKYLLKHPNICKILQSRFKYLFIDEMQDLEKYQIDIIEMIFTSETSNTTIQRIGDINQAIYNSSKKVKVQADWQPRNQMYLNNSNRLTPLIANIVNYFTLDRQQDPNGNPRFIVNGLRQNSSQIQPHLIVFDDLTKGNLEIAFSKLIIDNSLQNIPEAKKYGFKIIGWNASWSDDEESNHKLRLENIFPRYKKDAKSSKDNYDSLSKYLQIHDNSKKTLAPAMKAILNSLITVLKLENKTYQTTFRGEQVNRFFTKDQLINAIKNRDFSSDYELFKSKLYDWSLILMVKNQPESVYFEVKSFILNEFKFWFGLTVIEDTNEFIGLNFEKQEIAEIQVEEINPYDLKIDIGTVHSAKGQTHCATMYVETSYHDYETNKLNVVAQRKTVRKAEVILPNPMLGQEHAYRIDKDKRAKESMKMMYVGFSRPTHLLCFAVLKDNMTYHCNEYENAGWRIIDLTS